MNKFLARCYNKDTGKFLGKFDNNSEEWLQEYFRTMFPKINIIVQVVTMESEILRLENFKSVQL